MAKIDSITIKGTRYDIGGASSWDELNPKPFKTLDENTLAVDEEGVLSVIGGGGDLPDNIVLSKDEVEDSLDISKVLKTESSPIGTVISFMGTIPPKDFLVCDGTEYEITKYKKLANFFEVQFGSANFFGGNGTETFKVPDLRGEFLRGAGTNSHANQGDGDNVGVHQDATQHITMYSANDNCAIAFTDGVQISYTNQDKAISGRSGVMTTTNASRGAWAGGSRLYSARPTNTSILYCIKYDDHADEIGKKMHNYSTDEQIVGTWIDGRPVYEKTIILNNIPSGGGIFDIPHNIKNVERILEINTSNQVGSTFPFFPIPANQTSSLYDYDLWSINIQGKTEHIQIRKGNSITLTELTVIMRYIKTTN